LEAAIDPGSGKVMTLFERLIPRAQGSLVDKSRANISRGIE
jgi:hypothetical protein